MINKMILQGRLVRDPEIKETNSAIKYAKITVAWSEKYKDVEKKLFLDCTAWRGTAEFLEKYFTKGKEIIVEGQIETQTWQNDKGENRSKTELLVDKVHFCGSKADNGGGIDISVTDSPISDDDLPF